MSPGSSTESYPAFAHIGLRENPGKNLNQVTCPDRESNPGHLVSRPDALTVIPQMWTLLITKEGLLLLDNMPHGTTINSDVYVANLKKLLVRLSRVRRHREKQDVLLLHDNAQPYVSHKTTDQVDREDMANVVPGSAYRRHLSVGAAHIQRNRRSFNKRAVGDRGNVAPLDRWRLDESCNRLRHVLLVENAADSST
ncbi:hypothetical protein ANN_09366 [Periplaneta americana]|uniref:Mariner Mos1 transposase n=1 Tax=Periplaneta americana TaxID=6978 RepID=A0ABQ8TPP8_PERAM|nr:hypothetical protein ANN_09366 [Periplaneta americana]